jgi:predicted acyltransferase (DUF342 family)
MNSEKGQALPLAMLALAIGTLVITPFLGHASSNLIGSRVYEQGITELYSCDSGIEYAIWSLQSGALEVTEGGTEMLLEFTINNKTVNVSVENLGSSTYNVIATATSEDGHSSTIEATLSAGGVSYTPGNIELGWNETYTGDALADGDIILGSMAKIVGDAYATGNIQLGWKARITGDAAAGGDILVGTQATIDGSAHADGDIQLDWDAEIKGNACANGNITLSSEAEIKGDISTTGNIELGWNAQTQGDVFINSDIEELYLMSQAKIKDNVYILGDIEDIRLDYKAEIGGGVYITGNILGDLILGWKARIKDGVHENYSGEFPPPPECPSLPTVGGDITIITWE